MSEGKEIIIFAASQNFSEVSRQVVLTRNLGEQIQVIDATGETTLKSAEKLAKSGSKVFISRGRNTTLLKEHTHVPVIDVPYRYEEIYASVKAAGHPPDEIALIGFDKAYDIMNTFRELSGCNVQLIEPVSPDASEDYILRELRPGTRILIGGFSAKRVAERRGMRQIPLMVDPGNISLAIDSALNFLNSIEKKDEYLKTISTTVNCISNAVFNYDSEKNLLFSNDKARSLLETIDHDRLKDILFSQSDHAVTARAERMVNINGGNYIAEYLPVIVRKRFKSIVIMVSSENSIHSAEKTLRLSQNKRGYTARHSFPDIIGNSFALTETIHLAKKYAHSGSAVLITGETGTGKEIFAQSIHNQSARVREPFVAINCAALPQSLLESELFGYVRGAFTGASREGKMGIFEMAHKGTVFLDEIGEMALEVQAKLLRVLQEKEICRLGDDRVIPVDIRILSATNKDLPTLVNERKFREDLLYRLNVLELHLPPLRQRQSDIPSLIHSYMEKCGHPLTFSREAMSLLCRQPYPGNVRQLFNLLERIVTLAETDHILPQHLRGIITLWEEGEPAGEQAIFSRNKADFEKSAIENCLRKNGGSRSKTAAELNISCATLWRKMKRYDINGL